MESLKKIIITIFVMIGLITNAGNQIVTQSDYHKIKELKQEIKQKKQQLKFDELVEFVKMKEGWRSDVYICPGGYLTIGYGFRTAFIPKKFHYNLTKQDADSILRSKLIRNINTVEKHYPLLNYYQKVAVASLIYAKGFGRIIGSQKLNIKTHKLHYELKKGIANKSTWLNFSKVDKKKHYAMARKYEFNLFNYR